MDDVDTVTEKALPTDELTITLTKPVELGSEIYRELRLREPTAAEWIESGKAASGGESELKLVVLVSGVPDPAVRKLGMRDFLKATRHLERFLD